MRKTAFRSMAAMAALICVAVPAAAAVDGVGDSGFQVTQTAHVAASPDKVYDALIVPSRW